VSVPSVLGDLPPIDALARDGKFRLLTDGSKFAVGRWRDGADVPGAWVFSNGQPLGFEPQRYRP